MTTERRPEMEAVVQKRIQSGVFSSSEEVVERALELLSAEEDWLTENRDQIAAEIREGWEEAQRGELIDAEQVRADLQQFKQDWLKQRRST